MDYLPTPNAAQTRLIETFVESFESALQTKRIEISLAELWKGDSPDGPEHNDIAEYLRLVRCWLVDHARPLLSLGRLEAILITEILIKAWLALEINTRKNMGNLLSSTRLCAGSGEGTLHTKWCSKGANVRL